jgi:beta-phosphoglucomutase
MKAFIFDLDGVLCFTDKYHYQAWKEIADANGIYFDKKINNRLRGVSRADSLEIILEKADRNYSQEEKEELADRKNNLYVNLLANLGPNDVLKETKQTLVELKKRGFLLAIGSSSKNTKYILERVGLKDFFDATSDGTNITRSKPDPEVFIKAAQMLGVSPDEAIVVEDSMAGIEASCAGGFKSAGIGEASKHPGVTYSISKISDLLDIC